MISTRECGDDTMSFAYLRKLVKEHIERSTVKPKRTISKIERAISLSILLFLLAIAVVVAHMGRQRSIAHYVLSETAFAGVTKGTALKLQLPPTMPNGWKRGKIETYNANNLYEKIDGRAELYISYDVVELVCTSYKREKDEGMFVDVFIYDMGSPQNAFGIYSYERAGVGKRIKLGEDGYEAGGSIYFWKGCYYVQVVAAFEDEAMKQLCLSLAKTIESQLKGGQSKIWGLESLPKEGLVSGSIVYIKRKAFGHDFLEDVYTAQYRYGGKNIKAFVSKCKSANDARAKLAKWKEVVGKYGQVMKSEQYKGQPLFAGKSGGGFVVVFCKNELLGGVIEAEDIKLAEGFAKMFFEKLR